MLIIIFWVSAGAVFYTYFGYPVLLSLAAKAWKKEIRKGDIFPHVSLIIAAYNEEKTIEEKIKNCLGLDYPKDKIEIIVASDCSTDKTDEIVRRFEPDKVKLSRSQERRGKTAGRNRVIPESKGEVIILSDATGMYEKDAVKKLVRNLHDERVGGVGGILKYINPSNSMVGEGEGLYWRYETMLRNKESLIGNLMAVSGSIYAFRKNLYRKIPEELADDLIVPLTINKLGYYTVLEQEAVCIEMTTKNDKEESSKRARIANRNIMGLLYMKELFNFVKYGFISIELFSHKALRLLMPLFLIFIFAAGLILIQKSSFYAFFTFMQILFYLSACAGYIAQRHLHKKSRILYVPLFFCVSNWSVLLGILKFLSGYKHAIWEPAR